MDVGGFGRRGIPFRINQCGLKTYPAHITAQTAVVAGVALAKVIGDLDRIAAIEIGTTRRGYQIAGSDPEKWAPDTKETADHSLPYIVARAMVDGGLDNDSYAPEKLHDPRILALMGKITVKEDPAFATLTIAVPPTRLTATLHDGQRITRLVDTHAGFPGAADDPGRRRAEIPPQCRRALAASADGCALAGAVGARPNGRLGCATEPARGAGIATGTQARRNRLIAPFLPSRIRCPAGLLQRHNRDCYGATDCQPLPDRPAG